MKNTAVAQVFDEVADLLEIQGANPFRVRAYRNAVRTIKDLPEPLVDFIADPERNLQDLDGIGKDLAGKIVTILETGDLPMRQELREKVPPGLRELLNLPGLGPKRAHLLHKELGISSVDELRVAAEAHQIRDLKGFGKKTEEGILEGLEMLDAFGHRFYLAEAVQYADAIVRHLRGVSGLEQIAVAGSLRRRKETIGDLDVLVTCDNPAGVMDRLAEYDGVDYVLARGETKMRVRLTSGLEMDLRVVPDESYGAAMQYFTGSKDHNILVRRRAREQGLKINEYGVFRGEERVAGGTEQEVYAAVDLPWIEPELREARGEIEAALEDRLPTLVDLNDIRGDLHMHTTATDGQATLEEMVAAAKRLGYAYVAITDHSKRVTMAGGLDQQRLRQQWEQIDKLNGEVKGITILKGIELDILEDGSLDLPDAVLKDADWVVASLHYGQNQSREKITNRILGAVKNPYVSALGHPTGRLLGRRKSYDVDLDAVLHACADYGCLLEINAQPSRLDLDDIWARKASEMRIPLVINTDAHSVDGLKNMQYGVWQARRAGLEAKDVANTRTLKQFQGLLKRKT